MSGTSSANRNRRKVQGIYSSWTTRKRVVVVGLTFILCRSFWAFHSSADNIRKWTGRTGDWDTGVVTTGTNIVFSTPSSLPLGTPSDIPSLRPSSGPSSGPSSSPVTEDLNVVTSVMRSNDPVTNFKETLDKIDTNITVPSNLNIIMIGDSLTRYQYLSLVHYIQFGKWVNPKAVPNMVWEKTHEDFYHFYNYTKSLLEPFEQCDCFRDDNLIKFPEIFENRYFFQPSRNNSISYIQKFTSSYLFKSQWNVSDIHKQHELVQNITDLRYDVYQEKTWTEFIRNFVANMNPKPGTL